MHPSGYAALVTGGGSGLGRATAAKLAALGAKVAILDINVEAAAEVATKIGGIAIACDVVDADETAAAIAQARDRFGPARILINCAGIAPARRVVGRDGPMPLEDFVRVINVNLIGTFNAIRLAAHAMSTLDPLEDGERGVIVSTASVAAYDGQIGQAAYSASKGGVVSMMLPIARELSQFGIRLCAIAPGIFNTPMVSGMSGRGAAESRRLDPVPQGARPSGAICRPRAPHHREPLSQRRGDPARRRRASRAALKMLTNRHQVTIEWGHCDPAGIVYFPNYFTYFDSGTNALFLRALGYNKFEMIRRYGIVGIPLVDVGARFIVPSTFGDVVTIESTVAEIRRSSFRMQHRLLRGETLAVEGTETRVWVGRDPENPDKLKGLPIPDEVVAKLRG